MATSSDTNSLTVRQLVLLCISLNVAVSTPVFYILAEHASEMSEIRSSIITKTADRYFRNDAIAHEKLDAQKFRGVDFRFERNEKRIDKLEVDVEGCIRGQFRNRGGE